ncbi:MAG TPA: ABC transporter ATP-binding protein [Roseiflexaceae bacterium]|jgi:ABC-2 type transport system ATP-binding protein|nr:ABC transporter ATP-binding protein [Roseiflexaceae bacterium]
MAPIIETLNLSRVFGDRTAVDQLSLAIEAGTIFGFLGPNGAGKTTTVRMLAGLIAPTSGQARVAGHELGGDTTAIRRSVGVLTETPGLYDQLSAQANLVFFARLYGLGAADAERQARHYLELLGLADRADEAVGGFSKGMRQRVAIARALIHEPPVVFLDEPTSGLDPEASRMVREFVGNLRAAGRTVFLTTHNLVEAEVLCDMVGVFQTRLLQLGTPAQLRTSVFGSGTIVRFDGPAEPWQAALNGITGVRRITAGGDTLQVYLEDPDRANPEIVAALVSAGARVRYVEAMSHSLEEVYLQLLRPNGR